VRIRPRAQNCRSERCGARPADRRSTIVSIRDSSDQLRSSMASRAGARPPRTRRSRAWHLRSDANTSPTSPVHADSRSRGCSRPGVAFRAPLLLGECPGSGRCARGTTRSRAPSRRPCQGCTTLGWRCLWDLDCGHGSGHPERPWRRGSGGCRRTLVNGPEVEPAALASGRRPWCDLSVDVPGVGGGPVADSVVGVDAPFGAPRTLTRAADEARRWLASLPVVHP
jgi:hypothetical protein